MALYQRLLVGTILLVVLAGRVVPVEAKPTAAASKGMIRLAVPVINQQKHEYTIPAAFLE